MKTMSLKRSIFFLVSLILFLTTTACVKNTYLTQWPPWELYPRPLQSKLKANLPQGIKIIEPSLAIPEKIRKFSGIWYGNLGKKCNIDMKLAVEEIKQDGDFYIANVTYAVASERKKIEPTVYRLKGKFVKNELQLVKDELQIALPNEKYMVFFRRGSRSWFLNAKLVKINGNWWAIGPLEKQ